MFGKLGILVAAALWSVAADAQETALGSPVPPEPKPSTATGTASASPKYWFQIDLAPQISQRDPLFSDSDATDSTDIGWTLGLNYNLSKRVDIEARMGATATIDSDNDATASSKLVGSVRLRRLLREGSQNARNPWTLKAFARYQLGLRHKDFFADRDGTEHTFDAILALQIKFRSGPQFDFDAGPRRVESTLAGSDYTAFRLNPRVRLPLSSSVGLLVNGDVERRQYDGVDPAIGRSRQDWRFQIFVGLDLKQALIDLICRGRDGCRVPIEEFNIGARLIEIESNVASQEVSTLRLAGSVSLRIPLN